LKVQKSAERAQQPVSRQRRLGMETALSQRMAQEPENTPTRDGRRDWRAWAILLGLLLLFGTGVFIYPAAADRSPARNRDAGTRSSGTTPLGTSGRSEDPGAVIRELDTITGSNDGHELIGRMVDLHVPIAQPINDGAFWIGVADNRILVVLGRDDRDRVERDRGLALPANIRTGGDNVVAVSGTIQGLPRADAMSSWGLTDADREELFERRIYIHADATAH
jgi:hypothetical protein